MSVCVLILCRIFLNDKIDALQVLYCVSDVRAVNVYVEAQNRFHGLVSTTLMNVATAASWPNCFFRVAGADAGRRPGDGLPGPVLLLPPSPLRLRADLAVRQSEFHQIFPGKWALRADACFIY